MAKVIITLDDDSDNNVKVRIESDPAFPVDLDGEILTKAQECGLVCMHAITSKATKVTEHPEER